VLVMLFGAAISHVKSGASRRGGAASRSEVTRR
jgi:hypothetical protein